METVTCVCVVQVSHVTSSSSYGYVVVCVTYSSFPDDAQFPVSLVCHAQPPKVRPRLGRHSSLNGQDRFECLSEEKNPSSPKNNAAK